MAHWRVSGARSEWRLSNVVHIKSRRPKSDYERFRAWRERNRKGQACATVIYDVQVLALLVDAEWLRKEDAGDCKRVGAAITAMLADVAKKHHG